MIALPRKRRCGRGQSQKETGRSKDRPVIFFKRRMVLPPVPEPWTTPPAPTATTTTITVRFCGRAGRRGNRSGQGGYTDGGSDGCSDRRSNSADAPKHRNRHSCDGFSQQPARCQNAISHSAHPSFLSSHLRFQAGGMRDPRVSAATDDRAAECIPCALSHTFSLGKDPRDPYLGCSSAPGAEAPDGTNTAYA